MTAKHAKDGKIKEEIFTNFALFAASFLVEHGLSMYTGLVEIR